MPFPFPRVIALPNGENVSEEVEAGVVLNIPYTPTKIPNPLRSKSRRQVMLLERFAEEECLTPFWSRHHANTFHAEFLLDYNSTGSTRKIVEEIAPSWKVIDSTTGAWFEAEKVEFSGPI